MCNLKSCWINTSNIKLVMLYLGLLIPEQLIWWSVSYSSKDKNYIFVAIGITAVEIKSWFHLCPKHDVNGSLCCFFSYESNTQVHVYALQLSNFKNGTADLKTGCSCSPRYPYYSTRKEYDGYWSFKDMCLCFDLQGIIFNFNFVIAGGITFMICFWSVPI